MIKLTILFCASQRYAFKLRITVFITRRSLSLFQVEVF
ncbi:hypothetical protein UUU_04000 [Klebsiella pneumoniae subsp. pneumoniae DSM 30104 = JCM 1662 = NBRC 14940]|nr:hypothetical protein UUU_04000 [Klebsiella pneumoniae subsp. pneumoniae DSM 30104 = JCM 1662 = NBRC 14940]